MPVDESVVMLCEVPDGTVTHNELLKEYLLARSPTFYKLYDLKKRLWAKEEGDQYFQHRQEKSARPNRTQRESLFKMTVQIGHEMASKTDVFQLKTRTPCVLDLCMAPGGFTQSTLHLLPRATVHGITLPPDNGGYQVMVKSTNLGVIMADITMFSAEYGAHTDLSDHADAANFRTDRPYVGHQYDLVFCGGAVLRAQKRAPYREAVEGARLILSQLIFAFHRLRLGVNLVLFLYRAETWSTAQIIHTMTTMADVELFKPDKAHAIKSSFYLVARNVRSDSAEAVDALADWKRRWYQMTVGHDQDDEVSSITDEHTTRAEVDQLLREFGPQLMELGQRVWDIQANTLERFLQKIERPDIE